MPASSPRRARSRCGRGSAGRPRLDRDCRRRYRHRHDAGAAWRSCSRSSPRPIPRPRSLRRHRPRPRDQPPARAHDGRRRDGRERAGQGLGLHGAPAGRCGGGSGPADAGPGGNGGQGARPKARRQHDPGGRRRRDGARADLALSAGRGLCRRVRGQWRRSAQAGARAASGRDHARRRHAGPQRLERAVRAQGRPGTRLDPGGHGDDHRREAACLRARRHRLSPEADRAGAAGRAAGAVARERARDPRAGGRGRSRSARRDFRRARRAELADRRGRQRPRRARAAAGPPRPMSSCSIS